MRKFLSVSLAFVFVFVFVFALPYQEARADTLQDVLPSNLLLPVATLLVSAGLSFSTQQAIEVIARWWYSAAGEEVRNSLVNAVSSIVDGVMTVPSDVWQSIKSWVQSNFVTGASSITVPRVSYAKGTYTGYVTRYEMYDIASLVGGTYEISMSYVLGSGYLTIWHIFAVPQPEVGSNVSIYTFTGVGQTRIVTHDFYDGDVLSFSPSFSGDLSLQYEVSLVNKTVEYVGADVLTNPTWNVEKVFVPPLISDLVGKTYSDVVVSDTTIPSDTTLEGTVSGILSAVNTLVDVFTTGLIGDISQVHFPDLSVPITQKFPFCLPWDLMRLVGLLYDEPEAPRIRMTLGYPFNADIDIDTSLILPPELMEKIRYLELIGFAIGLVLVTKNLLGGAE